MRADDVRCDETELLVSRALDGELDAEETAKLEAHLAACPACRRVRGEMTSLVDSLASLEPLVPPDADALWHAFETKAGAAVTPVVPIARSRRRRRIAMVVVPLAAAAAVVLAVGLRRPTRTVDETLLRDAAGELAEAEAHYRRAADDLERLAVRERGTWTDQERTRFDAGLAALQHATATDRAAATARPADAEVAARLFGDYEKQIAYLEDAVLRPAQPPGGAR